MFVKFSTVWLLAAVNAVAMSAFPLMFLLGSIIGTQLAPSTQWATVPIALMVIGTASAVIPASRSMAIMGRQATFLLFVGVGVVACIIAGEALVRVSFTLFCCAAVLLGFANAALQQIRFAAMETVPLADNPTAASIVMCAGIIAAFIGPELALLGENLSSTPYQGSFWLAASCLGAGGILLLFYRPGAMRRGAQTKQPRPLKQMLKEPTIVLAVASGAVAFVIMSFIMTATPISMHVQHGHTLEDTKWVIQSHIAAMFLPSLATAWLFKLFKIRGMMIAGLCCYAVTITLGLLDLSVMGYWGQLVMLGIGWNFLFVAGTALLPTAHREGEQYKAQALNDSVIFSCQAIAALSAGWAISTISWQSILILCIVPMIAMVTLLLWQRRSV